MNERYFKQALALGEESTPDSKMQRYWWWARVRLGQSFCLTWSQAA